MLLSTKIFSRGFLHYQAPAILYAQEGPYEMSLKTLQKEIVNSTKFVVGHETIKIDCTITEAEEILYGKDCQKKSDEEFNEYGNRRIALWKAHAKLPFDSIFIENSTGGILLRKFDESIVFTVVNADGSLHPWQGIFNDELWSRGKTNGLLTTSIYREFLAQQPSKAIPGKDQSQELVEVSRTYIFLIMNALLYINTKNISLVPYRMSNHEASKKIPDSYRERFVYYVLDIFHNKKEYRSLEDVETYASVELTEMRRAHMVRGHFKTIRGVLYWWNSFLRCKKGNGMIAKDYAVH